MQNILIVNGRQLNDLSAIEDQKVSTKKKTNRLKIISSSFQSKWVCSCLWGLEFLCVWICECDLKVDLFFK